MRADVVIRWGSEVDAAAFAATAPDATDRERPGDDAELALAMVDDMPVARLATYRRHDLAGAPGTSGLVGHYAARRADAGVALLRAAVARLRAAGVARVLGPMNGTTWSRYRFAIADSTDAQPAPFLGEPVNPPEYPGQFAAAGFRVATSYESRIARDAAVANPRAVAAEPVVAARGIVIVPLDLARFDDELRDLHALSTRAFAGNLYYSPIALETFEAMYRPMRNVLDPAFVLLARAPDGSLAGYAFAYPDPLDLRDGRPYRLIVKTLAVDPAARSFGLGALLVERLHAAARERGIPSIIHALMHVDNDSMKISAHTADVFRRYVLFEHG